MAPHHVAPPSLCCMYRGLAAVPPRYENTVEVDPRVYANVDEFRRIDSNGKKKAPGDHLFGAWVGGCEGGGRPLLLPPCFPLFCGIVHAQWWVEMGWSEGPPRVTPT